MTTGDGTDDAVTDDDHATGDGAGDYDAPAAPPPETVPVDPHGAGPPDIPDPMPAPLQRTEHADAAFEESQPMEGEAPTG
jgi:hypothetical protein